MTELPPIECDPRFAEAIAAFNRRDFAEASDLFEELFFDASGAELEFARVFLQASVGFLHAERGQRRAAVQRLAEGIRAISRSTGDRGVDLERLRREMVAAVNAIGSAAPFDWPIVIWKSRDLSRS